MYTRMYHRKAPFSYLLSLKTIQSIHCIHSQPDVDKIEKNEIWAAVFCVSRTIGSVLRYPGSGGSWSYFKVSKENLTIESHSYEGCPIDQG